MEKLLILTDIDGTFVKEAQKENDFFNIPKENKEAFALAKEKGHSHILISGRPWFLVEPIYKQLNISEPVILSHGAVIKWPQGNKPNMITYVDSKLLFKFIEGKKYRDMIEEYMVSSEKHIYTKKSENVFGGQEKLSDVFTLYNEKNFNDNSVFLARVRLTRTANFSERIQEMKEEYGNAFNFIIWDNGTGDFVDMELVAKGVNKGKAIQKLLTYMNMPVKNTIAFGDGVNDLEMLKMVNLGVALKNASEEVKLLSDDVTEFDNDEGGVGIYLKRYFEKNEK